MRLMTQLSRHFLLVTWQRYKMGMTASSLPVLLVKQAMIFKVNSGWTATGQAVISVLSSACRGSYLFGSRQIVKAAPLAAEKMPG